MEMRILRREDSQSGRRGNAQIQKNHQKRKFSDDKPYLNQRSMLDDPWKSLIGVHVAAGILPSSELDKDFSFPSV